jgi:hypothetical protein
MFDIARAAVLRAGVAEDKLPRTHNGVIHRREARENWLRLRQLKIKGAKDVGHGHGKDTDREVKDDQSRSLDDDFDE